LRSYIAVSARASPVLISSPGWANTDRIRALHERAVPKARVARPVRTDDLLLAVDDQPEHRVLAPVGAEWSVDAGDPVLRVQ
jgi:hypothetical protein